MKSGFFPSGNINLYYEIHGEETGQPAIFLNGGPGFSHDYLRSMCSLAPEIQVIFYDQRGTGQSDKTDPSGYTIDANVEDVEHLRQALGLETFILFGHSWGGILAQAYALKYPRRIAKLVLADTFATCDDLNKVLARMRTAVPEETRAVYERCEREGLYQNGDRYSDEYQAALDIAYEPVSFSVTPPAYLEGMFSQLAYDVYRAMWGEESEFRVTGSLAGFNTLDRLGQIGAPALVMVGASDMPSVEMARQMANALPDARLEVFEHSRHYPFIEEPESFFRVLRKFLDLDQENSMENQPIDEIVVEGPDAQENAPESESVFEPQVATDVEGEQIQFGPGFAVNVSAVQDIHMTQAGGLSVSAGRDVEMAYGGALAVAAGQDMELAYGGAMVVAVGHDLKFADGVGSMFNVGNNLDMADAGALVAVSQQVNAHKSVLGIVLSPQVNVDEESTVVLNTQQALAFGAAFGAVFAILSWLFRKR